MPYSPADYLFDGFHIGMAILSAIMLWVVLYWPKVRETKQFSLLSLIALPAFLAVALGILRALRW